MQMHIYTILFITELFFILLFTHYKIQEPFKVDAYQIVRSYRKRLGGVYYDDK